MPNTCFDCIDGSIIHFANVKELILYRFENVDFVFVNGHRIYNDKKNKKLLKLIFPYLNAIGKKCKFTFEDLSSDDAKDFEEVIVDG